MRVAIGHKKFWAHRVAFAVTHGRWPDHEVDHINGVRSDNRPQNLREATTQQNSFNSVRLRTAAKGVSFYKRDCVWTSSITHSGVSVFLGRYKTHDEAAAAYRRAADLLFGDFAAHNSR